MTTWRNLPESELADLTREMDDPADSGAYAVATALSMLRDGRLIDVASVIRVADSWSTPLSILAFGVFGLLAGGGRRLWPGGPITPRQQANLAKRIGRQRSMRVKTQALRPTLQGLINTLHDPDSMALVTITWTDESRPRIAAPTGGPLEPAPDLESYRLGKTRRVRTPFAAHTMILMAHDPARMTAGVPTPWGFLSHWVDARTLPVPGLYWMPDDDFIETWTRRVPGLRKNTCLISR